MEYEDLKKILKEHGFTLESFSKYLGLTYAGVKMWKNNQVPPWIKRIIEGLEYKRDLKTANDRLKQICSEMNSLEKKKDDFI